MIKAVTAINYLGEALRMRLDGPDESGFEVHYVKGLDPGSATLNFSKTSTMPGDQFNSATVDGRNIVIGLGLLNYPTVEESRLRAYRYFPRMQEVTLLIETENRLVTTTGRVESNESEIFSQDKALQVSIRCGDAYLYDASALSRVSATFYGTEKKFEFPFSNESLTEKLIEFGSIKGILQREVTYNGDAEVGMSIFMSFSGPVQGLAFYNDQTNEAIRIDHAVLVAMTGFGLMMGDQVVLVTNPGYKSATLIRNGVRTNILNALGRGIVWPVLRKGNNRLAYSAMSGEGNVQIRMESLILYEGV